MFKKLLYLVVLLVLFYPFNNVFSATLASYTDKETPADADVVIIADSEDNWETKNLIVGSIGVTNLDNNPGTDTIEVTSSNGSSTTLPAATTSTAGVLTSSDKTKIDNLDTAAYRAVEDTLTDGSNIPDGAAIKLYGDTNWEDIINLSYNQTSTYVTITPSNGGTSTNIPLATDSLAGLLSPAGKTAIDGLPASFDAVGDGASVTFTGAGSEADPLVPNVVFNTTIVEDDAVYPPSNEQVFDALEVKANTSDLANQTAFEAAFFELPDGGGAVTSPNQQTGTTYTILTGDKGKTITSTNASAQIYTLLDEENHWFDLINRGAGTLSLHAPTSSGVITMNGTALDAGDEADFPANAFGRVIRTGSAAWSVDAFSGTLADGGAGTYTGTLAVSPASWDPPDGDNDYLDASQTLTVTVTGDFDFSSYALTTGTYFADAGTGTCTQSSSLSDSSCTIDLIFKYDTGTGTDISDTLTITSAATGSTETVPLGPVTVSASGVIAINTGHALATDLEAAYIINEGSGTTINDLTANEYDLTLSGDYTWGTDSITFGGTLGVASGTHTVVSDYPVTTVTVMSTDSTASSAYGVGLYDPTGSYDYTFVHMSSTDTHITGWTRNETDGNISVTSTDVFSVDTEYVIVYQQTAANARQLWINGVLQGSDTTSIALLDLSKICIGATCDSTAGYGIGTVKAAYVYSRELTTQEISDISSDPYVMINNYNGGN